MNGGGIRENLPEGVLTYNDIYRVLPFENSLAIVEIKGKELRRTLEIAYSGGHKMPGVAGLKLKRLDIAAGISGEWSRDLNQDGKKEDWERKLIIDIRDSSNQPIVDSKTYRLALNDYLVAGGDHQKLVFEHIPVARKHIYSGTIDRDVLVDFIQNGPRKSKALRAQDYYSPQNPRVQLVALETK
jgi:5'-nucleotidase